MWGAAALCSVWSVQHASPAKVVRTAPPALTVSTVHSKERRCKAPEAATRAARPMPLGAKIPWGSLSLCQGRAHRRDNDANSLTIAGRRRASRARWRRNHSIVRGETRTPREKHNQGRLQRAVHGEKRSEAGLQCCAWSLTPICVCISRVIAGQAAGVLRRCNVSRAPAPLQTTVRTAAAAAKGGGGTSRRAHRRPHVARRMVKAAVNATCSNLSRDRADTARAQAGASSSVLAILRRWTMTVEITASGTPTQTLVSRQSLPRIPAAPTRLVSNVRTPHRNRSADGAASRASA